MVYPRFSLPPSHTINSADETIREALVLTQSEMEGRNNKSIAENIQFWQSSMKKVEQQQKGSIIYFSHLCQQYANLLYKFICWLDFRKGDTDTLDAILNIFCDRFIAQMTTDHKSYKGGFVRALLEHGPDHSVQSAISSLYPHF